MTNGTLHRLSAFTDDPAGGNPAGVWVGPELPDAATMQKIAADVGASETAFVAPATGIDREVRYFSPEVEVSFCGHATIATGVVLGASDGEGTYRLATSIGEVPVTARVRNGNAEASLVSVETEYKLASKALLDEALLALGWDSGDLDNSIQPALAYAGAWHLVLAVSQSGRLAQSRLRFRETEIAHAARESDNAATCLARRRIPVPLPQSVSYRRHSRRSGDRSGRGGIGRLSARCRHNDGASDFSDKARRRNGSAQPDNGGCTHQWRNQSDRLRCRNRVNRAHSVVRRCLLIQVSDDNFENRIQCCIFTGKIGGGRWFDRHGWRNPRALVTGIRL